MRDIALLVLLFWALWGISILRDEIMKNNKKLTNLTFYNGLKIFIKAMIFGPRTRSKVLDKL